MGKYTLFDGKGLSCAGPHTIVIQDVVTDFRWFIDNSRIFTPPWAFMWEPIGKEAGDKVVLSSGSREAQEKMYEIVFALAYPRRATGYDAWVFYDLADIERDEFGFIVNATIKRVSTA